MDMLLATEEQLIKYEQTLGQNLHKLMSTNREEFLKRLEEVKPYEITDKGIKQFFEFLCEIYISAYTLYKSLEKSKKGDDFTLHLMSKAREQMTDLLLFGHLFYLTQQQEETEGKNITYAEIDEKERRRKNKQLAKVNRKICKECKTELSMEEFPYSNKKTGSRQAKCVYCK